MKCHDWSARAERRDVAFCRGETRSWQESVWSPYCVGSVLLVSESYSPSAVFYLSSNYFRTGRCVGDGGWRMMTANSSLHPVRLNAAKILRAAQLRDGTLATHTKKHSLGLCTVSLIYCHIYLTSIYTVRQKKKKETPASFLVYSP